MYKSKLQELCQRRSWNLPEYSTVKDGPDHTPKFKATAVVNGQNFETPEECRSAKDAQNRVAKIAYDYFNISTLTHVHGGQSPPADSAGFQPLFPAACFSPVPPVPEMGISVPVSPPPSSLPLPQPGLLAPNNSALTKPVHTDKLQPNSGDTAQNSKLYKASIGHSGTLHIYKNQLQQYAQKKDLVLPVYTSEAEGPPHARSFKSRVSFDGKSYETIEFFHTLKEAEHAAAKVACQMLQIDQEDGGLHKNLLQELAQKRGYLCPTYETLKSGPPHRSIFVSIVEIGSRKFRGDEAKSKKLAEMNASTVAYRALTESILVTECSKLSPSMECLISDNSTQTKLPTGTMKRDELVANEASLLTECSKVPSIMECVVSENFTQRTLSTETMKRDEFPADEASFVTECSKVSPGLECVISGHSTQIGIMKRDEFVADEETEFNTKRVKCYPEKETANSPALLPPNVSSAQVEHQPVAGQHEAQLSVRSKTVIFPRKSDFSIPEGASVMSCSNDQWVAYKVELNQEPTP